MVNVVLRADAIMLPAILLFICWLKLANVTVGSDHAAEAWRAQSD